MSLDPQTSAAAQEQQAEAAPEDMPLDPPFPYMVIQFDPRQFGTTAESASETPVN